MVKTGLITFTIGKAGFKPVQNLSYILSQISSENYLVATISENSENMPFSKKNNFIIKHEGGGNIFCRIYKVLKVQYKISYILIKNRKKTDTLFFFMGGEILLLPIVVARILKKDVNLCLAASHKKMSYYNKDYLSILTLWICNINFFLASSIIIYSKSLIKEWELEKYSKKIRIACHHQIDLKNFRKYNEIDKRKNIIGYIGRLSPEKGVMNLIKAIKPLTYEKNDLKFLFIGEGKLKQEMENYIELNNLEKKVDLIDWVPNDKLPNYLNQFKLLVLPSYTEGLPNVVLEGMACGTPVLCSSVGAIPDLIQNNENGFILNENSPECILKNINEIFSNQDLEKISKKSVETVNSKFNKKNIISRYEDILKKSDIGA